MRCDLENAVSGGIHDKVASAEMFLAVVSDYLGSAVGLVAEHSPAGGRLEFADDLLRESVRKCREGLLGHYA